VGGGFIPLVGISIREQLIADKRRALQEDLGEHKPPITILQLSDCYHLVGEAGAEGMHSLDILFVAPSFMLGTATPAIRTVPQLTARASFHFG
jgi:hypothetical protein